MPNITWLKLGPQYEAPLADDASSQTPGHATPDRGARRFAVVPRLTRVPAVAMNLKSRLSMTAEEGQRYHFRTNCYILQSPATVLKAASCLRRRIRGGLLRDCDG